MRWIAVLTIVCGLGAAGLPLVEAAADTPPAKDCAQSYVTLQRVRARERELNYLSEQKGEKLNFTGLGGMVGGYQVIGFEDRARDLVKRYPDKFDIMSDVLAMNLGMSQTSIDNIVLESTSAKLQVLLSPEKLYQAQEALFARVRACDIAYGFDPVLGTAPTVVEIATKMKAAMDRESDAKEARLSGLTDIQCGARFAAMAQFFPAGSPGQASMQQRTTVMIGKIQQSHDGMTPDRIGELMRREMTELSSLLQSKRMESAALVDETNACERKFGMPVSTITQNAPN